MQEKLVSAYQSSRHLARITVTPLVPNRQFTMYCTSCIPDNVQFHSYPAQGEINCCGMPQVKLSKAAWVSLFAVRATCSRCLLRRHMHVAMGLGAFSPFSRAIVSRPLISNQVRLRSTSFTRRSEMAIYLSILVGDE